MNNSEVGLSAFLGILAAASFSMFVYGCTEVQKSTNAAWIAVQEKCLEKGGQITGGGSDTHFACIGGGGP